MLSGKLDHGFFCCSCAVGNSGEHGKALLWKFNDVISLEVVFFLARASYSAKTLSQGPEADGEVVESLKPRSSSVDRTLLRTELLPMRHHVMSRPQTVPLSVLARPPWRMTWMKQCPRPPGSLLHGEGKRLVER